MPSQLMLLFFSGETVQKLRRRSPAEVSEADFPFTVTMIHFFTSLSAKKLEKNKIYRNGTSFKLAIRTGSVLHPYWYPLTSSLVPALFHAYSSISGMTIRSFRRRSPPLQVVSSATIRAPRLLPASNRFMTSRRDRIGRGDQTKTGLGVMITNRMRIPMRVRRARSAIVGRGPKPPDRIS